MRIILLSMDIPQLIRRAKVVTIHNQNLLKLGSWAKEI